MARNDTKAEAQHLVPKKALLKNFAFGDGAGKVFVFDKVKGKMLPQPTSVEKILKQRDFYTLKNADLVLCAEQGLTDLEELAAPIIRALITAQNLSQLANEQRYVLSLFLAAQHLRSPKIRTAQKSLAVGLAEKAERLAPKASNLDELWRAADDDSVKARSISLLSDATKSLANLLFTYRWGLHKVPENQELWLSDCPVVLHNDETGFFEGALGFAVPRIQIGIPLSSSIWLSIWHPKIVSDLVISKNESKELLGTIKGHLSFGINPDVAMLSGHKADLEKVIKRVSLLVDNLDHGDAIPASDENVEHFNSLQYGWANRFIVSQTGQFSLAEKMHRSGGAEVKFTM